MTKRIKFLLLVLLFGYVVLSHMYRLFYEDDFGFRDAQTAMITKNFVLKGFNPLMPQIDFNGPTNVYMVLEFPLYNMMVSGLYFLFGIHSVLGKIVSVIFFLGSCGYLFLLVKRLTSQEIARDATIIYSLLPITQYMGQAFMPDMLIYFLLFGFIYHAMLVVEYRSWVNNALMVLYAVSSAVLKMTPIMIIGGMILWAIIARKIIVGQLSQAMIVYGIAFILSAGALAVWYVHSTNVHSIYFPYFTGESFTRFNFGTLGDRFSPQFYWTIIKKSSRFLTPPFIILWIFGFLISFREGRRIALLEIYTIIAILSYLVFWNISVMNEHYLLIFSLPLAVYSSYAFQHVRQKWFETPKRSSNKFYQFVAVAFIVFTLGYNVFINVGLLQRSKIPYERILRESALDAKTVIPSSDLVLSLQGVPDGFTAWNDPRFFYYSERVGKNVAHFDQLNQNILAYKAQGYRWLVISFGSYEGFTIQSKPDALQHLTWMPDIRREDPNHIIVKL